MADHFVLFLPFLRLEKKFTVGGFEFAPLMDSQKNVTSGLESALSPLRTILSGYADRKREPVTNCVVLSKVGADWDLTPEDMPAAQWATSLLFLASWAQNDYYPRFSRKYVNSTYFYLVGQSWSGATPERIAVSARRRDGWMTAGGYKHGEFAFDVPPQVSLRDTATVDEPLLAALDAGNAQGSATIDRLGTALPFVSLANTDDDVMTPEAEVILLGSAFDQLLPGHSSARALAERFGALFGQFGSATVAEALVQRPGIQLDPNRVYAAAQLQWWVHRKWMEELYFVRSKAVHHGRYDMRTWGWQIAEHLTMAAHVLPRVVKLLLADDGCYTMTLDDRVSSLAVDPLLASTHWVHDDEIEKVKSWQDIMASTRFRTQIDEATEAFMLKHPDAFKDVPEK